MHGSKIQIGPKLGWFAVVIGLDGRRCQRRAFPNRKLALEWIEKEATAFRGKAERVELYDGRKVLMRSKKLGSSR